MIINIPQAFREGTFISASSAIPAGVTDRALLILNLQDADQNDPTLLISMELQGSYDNGISWHSMVRVNDFQCGRLDKSGNPLRPNVAFAEWNQIAGGRLRILVEFPRRVRCGATITTN